MSGVTASDCPGATAQPVCQDGPNGPLLVTTPISQTFVELYPKSIRIKRMCCGQWSLHFPHSTHWEAKSFIASIPSIHNCIDKLCPLLRFFKHDSVIIDFKTTRSVERGMSFAEKISKQVSLI